MEARSFSPRTACLPVASMASKGECARRPVSGSDPASRHDHPARSAPPPRWHRGVGNRKVACVCPNIDDAVGSGSRARCRGPRRVRWGASRHERLENGKRYELGGRTSRDVSLSARAPVVHRRGQPPRACASHGSSARPLVDGKASGACPCRTVLGPDTSRSVPVQPRLKSFWVGSLFCMLGRPCQKLKGKHSDGWFAACSSHPE